MLAGSKGLTTNGFEFSEDELCRNLGDAADQAAL
jgi:hypothetical protein